MVAAATEAGPGLHRPLAWNSFRADLLASRSRKMMGFLRRTFSRRSRIRFQTRDRDERDGKVAGGGGGGEGVAAGVAGNPLLLAHQQQVVHAPAVVTAGASVHIPAAGTARTTITCRVLLLDGSDVTVDLPVSALASVRCDDSGVGGKVQGGTAEWQARSQAVCVKVRLAAPRVALAGVQRGSSRNKGKVC